MDKNISDGTLQFDQSLFELQKEQKQYKPCKKRLLNPQDSEEELKTLKRQKLIDDSSCSSKNDQKNEIQELKKQIDELNKKLVHKDNEKVCESHNLKDIEFICTQCNETLCSLCILPKHKGHIQKIRDIKPQNFKDLCQQLIKLLQDEKESQKKVIQFIQKKIKNIDKNIQNMNQTNSDLQVIDSKVFKIQFDEISKILNLSYDDDILKKNDCLSNQILIEILEGQNQFDSLIFNDFQIKSKFMKLFKNGNKLKLIHRASKDSLKKYRFHQNVDGKGPYVFLIKSGVYIFGGYTDIQIPNSRFHEGNGNSFIFNFNKNKNFSIFKNIETLREFESVIDFEDEQQLFTFGFESNLSIKANNEESKGVCYLDGSYYERPESLDDFYSYLAGSMYFRVDELEVFQLI